MTLIEFVAFARNKGNFITLDDYINFTSEFLEFLNNPQNIQAVIVSQNASHYQFIQYKENGTFNITRPINTNLFFTHTEFNVIKHDFIALLGNVRATQYDTPYYREILNRTVYTIQQCIGSVLDALPATASNTARKINGDLFERFVCLILTTVGVDCASGTVTIPIEMEDIEPFDMSYQHDLIVKQGEFVKAIGSVKTSSKDRIDKIFIDKFLYSRLSVTSIPHFAVFLNDVQRKNVSKGTKYGINQTFLTGKFKAYTVKLNALDGVYYCDIRPIMTTDQLLRDNIRTFDHLIFTDIWNFLDNTTLSNSPIIK